MTGITWLDGVGYGDSGHRYRITDDRGVEVRSNKTNGWTRLPNRGPERSGPGAAAAEHEEAATVALDPNPYLYQYPDGADERAEQPPLTSRVGWLFVPRRGYEQAASSYPAPATQYAHLRRTAGDPATLSERIDTIEDPAIRMQQQDQYDHDAGMVVFPRTAKLPLDPEPWAWWIRDHDSHIDSLTHDGLHGWTRFRPRAGYEPDPVQYGLAADWVHFDPARRPTTQHLRDGSEVSWWAEQPWQPDQWVPCPSESVAREFVAKHANLEPNLRVAMRTVIVQFHVVAAEN